MHVLAALGDAPTAAIAVVAILLGVLVVARGRRGHDGLAATGGGGDAPSPSLLAIPGARADEDGLRTMTVGDIGHGTIRLGGHAAGDEVATLPPLPPREEPEAVEPEPVVPIEPEPEPIAWRTEPTTEPEPEPQPGPGPAPWQPPVPPEPTADQPPPPELPPAPEPPAPAPSTAPFRQGTIRLRKPDGG